MAKTQFVLYRKADGKYLTSAAKFTADIECALAFGRNQDLVAWLIRNAPFLPETDVLLIGKMTWSTHLEEI